MNMHQPALFRRLLWLRHSRRMKHLILLFFVPALMLGAGIYYWIEGMRYVSTDNAYVKRDKVSVSADIAGRIIEVAVDENQVVRPGDLLFRLDDAPFRLELEKAEAELANARLTVEQMRATYRERLADLAAAEQEVDYQQREFVRQEKLRASGFAAQAAYDKARYALTAAEQRRATERQAVQSALAALGHDPAIETDRHPLVMEAIAKRDRARLNLGYTEVRAPVGGIVSRSERLQPGQYAIIGAPMVSIVHNQSVWVEANFKETDITNMVPGQIADVTFDAFPGQSYKARIDGIGAATGAEFSLLPPQNATGNWVKIVQRVPVRLKLVDPTLAAHLQAGLSADVTVDTGRSWPFGASGEALAWRTQQP